MPIEKIGDISICIFYLELIAGEINFEEMLPLSSFSRLQGESLARNNSLGSPILLGEGCLDGIKDFGAYLLGSAVNGIAYHALLIYYYSKRETFGAYPCHHVL